MRRMCLEDYIQENQHLLEMSDEDIIRHWVADNVSSPCNRDFLEKVAFWSKRLQKNIKLIRTGISSFEDLQF